MKPVQQSGWRSVWQSLLLVVLLCAQGSMLAHELEHAPGLDDTPCAACSVGSQLQHGVVAQAECPTLEHTNAIVPVQPDDSLHAIAAGFATARAPPSLH